MREQIPIEVLEGFIYRPITARNVISPLEHREAGACCTQLLERGYQKARGDDGHRVPRYRPPPDLDAFFLRIYVDEYPTQSQILTGGGFTVKLKPELESLDLMKVCTSPVVILVHKSFKSRLEAVLRSKNILHTFSSEEKKLLAVGRLQRDDAWWIDMFKRAGCSEIFVTNWGAQLTLPNPLLENFALHLKNRADLSRTHSGVPGQFTLFRLRMKKCPKSVKELLRPGFHIKESVFPKMGHFVGERAGTIQLQLNPELCHGINAVKVYLCEDHLLRESGLSNEFRNAFLPPHDPKSRAKLKNLLDTVLARLKDESVLNSTGLVAIRLELSVKLTKWTSFDQWLLDSPFDSAEELTDIDTFWQKVFGLAFNQVYTRVLVPVAEWEEELTIMHAYARDAVHLYSSTQMSSLLAQARVTDLLHLLGSSNRKWKHLLQLKRAWDPNCTGRLIESRSRRKKHAWCWEDDQETRDTILNYFRESSADDNNPGALVVYPEIVHPELENFLEARTSRAKRQFRLDRSLGGDLTMEQLENVKLDIETYALFSYTGSQWRATYRAKKECPTRWIRRRWADEEGQVLDPTKNGLVCRGGTVAAGAADKTSLITDIALFWGKRWHAYISLKPEGYRHVRREERMHPNLDRRAVFDFCWS